MVNPDHLRAAIEKIGIEKPSDSTLVLEEVERMSAGGFFANLTDEQKQMALSYRGPENHGDPSLSLEEVGTMEAEEKLVERVANAISTTVLWIDDTSDTAKEHEPVRYMIKLSSRGFEPDVIVKEFSSEDAARSSLFVSQKMCEAQAAIEASGLLHLLYAAEAFIAECESMGYGKTSEKALPGSFDALVKAVREVKG